MNATEVRDILEKTGALMTGHFKLSSGKHSDTYVQKQRVLEHPRWTTAIGTALAHRYGAQPGEPAPFNVVVAPALGAISLGFAVAYAAGTRFLFTERADGAMVMRRGQQLTRTDVALVVEDVITTGGSAQEVIDLVEAAGARALGVAAIVDRSNAPVRFHLEALLRIEARDWEPDGCPLCASGDPIESPGSRFTGT